MSDYYTLTYSTKEERRARLQELSVEGYADVWGTQEGHLIPVTHLRDSHLKNCCQHVNRHLQSLKQHVFEGEIFGYELCARESDWFRISRRVKGWEMLSKEYVRRFGEEPTLHPDSLWLVQNFHTKVDMLLDEESREWEWIMTGW